MLSSSLSKTALFFFLVLSNQMYCVHTQTTSEDDEGTTGEVLSISTTDVASGTTGEALPVGSTTDSSGNNGDGIPVPPPVTGNANSSTTITTFWGPSSASGTVKRQAGYQVIEEISSDNTNFHQINTGSATEPFSFVSTDLTPNTQYYFRVFLSGNGVVSPYSPVTVITTLNDDSTGSGAATTQTVGPANSVAQEATQGTSQKQGGLSGGVIAGIVIAVIAVVAAIAAVVAKTAFASSAPVAGHWLDSAVQNPLYQAGEQAFENPMYEAPAEATA